jgi:hypothetical protein
MTSDYHFGVHDILVQTMTVFVFISDIKPTEENSDDDNNTALICGVVVVLPIETHDQEATR